MEQVCDKIEDVLKNKEISAIDGFEFSNLMADLLVSENGYVIDTGNYANVNYAILNRLISKIRKHPLLWKWFFRVA